MANLLLAMVVESESGGRRRVNDFILFPFPASSHSFCMSTLFLARLLVVFALVVCVLANTDYYSVLGVKRGVNEKDLKKACTLFLSLYCDVEDQELIRINLLVIDRVSLNP